MRAKVKWLIIVVVLFAIASILLVVLISASSQKPETRLSWQEQLARVQRAVAEVDPNATLGTLYASVFYDDNGSLGRKEQNDPLSVTSVLFKFYGEQPYKIYTLFYVDVLTNSLVLNKNTGELPPDSDRIPLAHLSTMVQVGPFEACRSTLPVAQRLMHVEITQTRCSVLLYQGLYARDKFGVPAVWSIQWTSYESHKESQRVHIWLDTATGEQLEIEADVRKES